MQNCTTECTECKGKGRKYDSTGLYPMTCIECYGLGKIELPKHREFKMSYSGPEVVDNESSGDLLEIG